MAAITSPDTGSRGGAPLRWGDRALACAAGAFTGAGTVALWAEHALGPAVARVRDALTVGAPLDAQGMHTFFALVALAERLEPVARLPAWGLGVGVVALIGALCALAARLIRRGGRTAWFAASLAAPLTLAWALWPAWG